MNKKGIAAINLLILLITFILIAAIAASVMISTAGQLENKAMALNSKGEEQIGTIFEPVYFFGEDASTDRTLEYFQFRVKVKYGSGINLKDVMVEMNTFNGSASLSYRDGACEYNATHGYYTNVTTGMGNYTVFYAQQNNKNFQRGYLQRGDVVVFCFAAPYAVQEDKEIEMYVIPKVGTTLYLDVNTPDIMPTNRIQLYPPSVTQ